MTNKLQILKYFFTAGCLGFGGPMAHVAYFRTLFVQRLAWLDDENFVRLNALCTILPGPSSSQLGFAIGYFRAGIAGALLAFIGFTLPSFILMTSIAIGLLQFDTASHYWLQLISALKLFALIVVADACAGMFNQLCTTLFSRWLFILTSALFITGMPPLFVIVGAGLWGVLIAPKEIHHTDGIHASIHWRAAGVFIALAIMSSIMSETLWGRFFGVGSSVFGGGHVVLPIIEQTFAQTFNSDELLAGYALAQAVPGPMFTIASYLGALSSPGTPIIAALTATLAIFSPGFLLVLTFYQHWQTQQKHPLIQGLMLGLNPAMIGLLASTLFAYILPNTLHTYSDLILFALAALVACRVSRGMLWAAVILIAGNLLM